MIFRAPQKIAIHRGCKVATWKKLIVVAVRKVLVEPSRDKGEGQGIVK